MSVSIGSSPTLDSNTLYRNKPFDISFSLASAFTIDTSLSFSNSTYGLSAYISNGHFKSTPGISTLGSLGTLSVDILTANPRVVTTVTPQSYLGTVGVCTDPSGNVYFAHANGNKIYKIDVSGVITTFAGTGTAGDSNGPRLTAQFRAPAGVVTDGSGTFYVTDSYRVRKIDSNGTVSTIAGSTTQGYVDGRAAARFFLPSAMALRPNGDLLVTESDYHTIRNVTLPGGIVTTYAGGIGLPGYVDGTLNTASVTSKVGFRAVGSNTNTFTGMILDSSDGGVTWTATETVFANPGIKCVFSNSGTGFMLYGGGSNATYGSMAYQSNVFTALTAVTGLSSSFLAINSIAFSGSRYVAGGTGNLGMYFSDNGTSWSVDSGAGTNILNSCKKVVYGGGAWLAIGLGYYDGFTFSTSNLLTSTNGSNWTRTAVCTIPTKNGLDYGAGTWVIAGTPNGSSENLAFSKDSGATWTYRTLSLPSGGDLGTVTYGNGTWVVTGYLINYISSDASGWTAVSSPPAGVPYYSAQSNLWIIAEGATTYTSSDASTWTTVGTFSNKYNVLAITDVNDASVTQTFGTSRMYFPYGLLYDPSGNLIIADMYNNRLRRVTSGSNTMTTFAGTGADSVSNGTLTTAGTARPSGLARDSSGTIYIASQERSTIQSIVGSNVSLYAGAYFSPGYADGLPFASRFNGPSGLATFGNALYIGEVYNADVRKIVTFPEVRPDVYHPPGYTIIATSNYPLNVKSRIDVSWTSVGGVLTLYKYESFCNTFTANGSPGSFPTTSDTLGYSTSSPELFGYLTGTGTSNVLFRATNGATVAYPSLNLTVQAISNSTVVDSVSTTVTINAPRILVTPCNTNLTFYRNEPSTNPVFSLADSSAQIIYSTSALPAGLTLVKTSSNAFTLTGTPTVQTFGSNYTILGQDTLGRTYSTQVTMVVNPERLIIDVSGSLTLTGLTSNAPIDPITFTSRFPPYGLDRAVTYSWFPAPPAGLQFKLKGGTAVFGLSQSIAFSNDGSFALTLSGTITSDQIRTYASSNISSTSLVFNGVRTNGGGLLSPAVPKTITFEFAETILFDSNVLSLYVGRAVSNTYYSAKTYFPFPTDTSIDSIVITDGYIPDGLDASFTKLTQRFTFTGTPTNAASYFFTLQATNGAGRTASLPTVMTALNDSVVITPTSDLCFNFIQYRSLADVKDGFYGRITYTAASSSGGNVVLTGSSLPTGVTLVAAGPSGVYDLSGRPTTASALTTATLTATVPSTGATSTRTFQYSVSAEVFTFNDLSLSFLENVPITPAIVTATTLSEQPIIRYSSPSLPTGLQIANTGRIFGTLLEDTSGTFDVTAYTQYSSSTRTYTYSTTPDTVLLQPSVYTTITAPGCNVSIQINGYSASATTVSNYRFSAAFPYGLAINSTTGLLSGTLASSLPNSTTFTLVGTAGTVDGSLAGTMTTNNLTVNRAQMIEMRATSNLYIYYSDDNGATWSDAYSQSNLLASRIGTNGSNLYLVPTSSDTLLASTTGSNFTTRTVTSAVGYDPRFTGIVNKPGTSTWWIGGTLSNGTRSAYVFKSTDDGVSWGSGVQVTTNGFTDRAGNPASYSTSNAYLNGGVSLAYKDGVLLLGGNQALRSEDEGATWSAVSTGLIEVADFSVDHETVWLAAGSSLYPSSIDKPYEGDATTIVYSTDQGATWSASVSPFVRNAYQVLYAGNAWMAVGLNGPSAPYRAELYASFDGVNWMSILNSPTYFGSSLDVYPLGPLAPIGFDETDWKLIDAFTGVIDTHPYDTDLLSGWTTAPLTGGSISGATTTSRFYSYVAQTIDPGADVTTITFPLPNTGPVFTSPAQSTYVLWQYMPIPAISFLAPGATSYFVSTLPIGLTWDPVTRTITGAAVQTGTQSFTVYAQNSGLTALTITLIVEVPRIIKQQSGAGAYTSLLRQYTTVNAAQKARDTRAFPTQVTGIGEFASPYPPDVITPSNCPC